MHDKVYNNIVDSFRRWKVSQKGITENSLIGYGHDDEYQDSINLGLYKHSTIPCNINSKKWFYITNMGINVLEDWENLGLDLSFYDSYKPNIPNEMRFKLINCISERIKSVA